MLFSNYEEANKGFFCSIVSSGRITGEKFFRTGFNLIFSLNIRSFWLLYPFRGSCFRYR